MTSPSLEIQGAILSVLRSDSAVVAIIGQRSYDSVPPTPVFPYTSFGPSDETSDDADCITGFEISFQIDCWSRKPGYPEVRALADAVRKAIHGQEFDLTVNKLVLFEHRQTRFLRDSDGLTSHAAMTFTAFVEAA